MSQFLFLETDHAHQIMVYLKIVCHCPSLSSLHWEQLSCHSSPLPENVCPHQVHLHPVPGQNHLSAAELTTLCSGTETTDTDRWVPQQLGSPMSSDLIIPSSSFQISTILRDTDTAAKFIDVGGATVEWLALGLGLRLCMGRCQEAFSEAAALLCHSGLCLLGDHEGLLLDGDLSHLVHHVKEPFPPPMVLSFTYLLS